MVFEWDDEKRRANLARHGIDFEDGAVMWLGSVLEDYERRWIGGELRILAVGTLPADEKIVAMVYTRRGARIRIISMRRARDYERRDYRKAFGRGS